MVILRIWQCSSAHLHRGFPFATVVYLFNRTSGNETRLNARSLRLENRNFLNKYHPPYEHWIYNTQSRLQNWLLQNFSQSYDIILFPFPFRDVQITTISLTFTILRRSPVWTTHLLVSKFSNLPTLSTVWTSVVCMQRYQCTADCYLHRVPCH